MTAQGLVRTIAVTVHGRYLIRPGDAAKLLVGFHGYGESGETHLGDLGAIPRLERWTIVAIQALHPFYNRKTGDVVANWMTKQDRELATADNLAYVRSVLVELAPAGQVVFAGFSQGASMAWRAAAANPCQGVVVLGGDLPSDVSAQIPVHPLPPSLVGRGLHDDWYTGDKLKKDLSFLRQGAAQVTVCEFDGGHEWSDPFRSAAADFLERL